MKKNQKQIKKNKYNNNNNNNKMIYIHRNSI